MPDIGSYTMLADLLDFQAKPDTLYAGGSRSAWALTILQSRSQDLVYGGYDLELANLFSEGIKPFSCCLICLSTVTRAGVARVHSSLSLPAVARSDVKPVNCKYIILRTAMRLAHSHYNCQ